MIRIGICDEAEKDLQTQKAILQDMIGKACMNAEILCFQSGEALLLEIEQNKRMDIILMEVGLQGINGVETAKRIRVTDINTLLIFITRDEQYWKEIINCLHRQTGCEGESGRGRYACHCAGRQQKGNDTVFQQKKRI